LFEDPLFKTDRIPHLLPIRNARVVDLRTGEVRTRTADDFFSFECDVDFDGNLSREIPHAERFFADVFETASLITYMQTQFGYCLTGETVARCFFVWYGIGSNGKSECSKILKRVLGDFFTTLAPKAVMTWKDSNNGPGNASPHLVTLAKARCAMVSETGPNDSINENFVKSWTGSDEICVRALYADEEKIKPQAKLVIQTNNKPKISAEQAIIDRTHMTEFGARFTKNPAGREKKADPEFVRALLEEHIDQVFLWMLHGSIRFYSEGLKLEDSALNSTLSFFQENDHLGAFLRSQCFEAPYCKIPRTDLYAAFKVWCEQNFIPIATATEFYGKLTNKGFELGSGGQRKVKGLRLKKAPRDEDALQARETRMQLVVDSFIQGSCTTGPSLYTPRTSLYSAFVQAYPEAQCVAGEFYAHVIALGFTIGKGGCRNVAGLALRFRE
jgi:putative DNA primase/helicase